MTRLQKTPLAFVTWVFRVFLIFIEVELIYNVLLVSGIWHSDSGIWHSDSDLYIYFYIYMSM